MRTPDFVPVIGHKNPDADIGKPDPYLHADLALSRQIAEVVERHYFGHPFKVMVDHRQGVVLIKIPQLMGAINWFCVHISDLKSDPQMKQIVRGCGDILERFNLPRAAYSREDFIAAIESVPLINRVSGRGYLPS